MMAISYYFTKTVDYLLVTASGEDESLNEVINYGKAIIDFALKSRASKILCDERNLIYKLNILDTFENAKTIAQLVPTLVMVAIVCDKTNMPVAHFWEDVANNRGLKVKFFIDFIEAENWIKPANL